MEKKFKDFILADEPNPPVKRKSWGFHLLTDMSGCDEKMDSPAYIKKFFTELISDLKMVKLSEIMIKDGPYDTGGHGLSAVQLINTSSITLHTDTKNMCVYLDIFSCKDFKQETIIPVIKKFFNPKHIVHQMIYRDAGLQQGKASK